ncbi:MAG: hypothetical protein ACP5H3_02085 [Candidatus Aenigmatarchaeota archaeon]
MPSFKEILESISQKKGKIFCETFNDVGNGYFLRRTCLSLDELIRV